MLIEFRVKNYKSFKDEQVFSMVASSDKSLLESNTISHPALSKKRLLRSAILYGANASGKSNLLDAVRFVTEFIDHSYLQSPNRRIPVMPFLLNSQSKTEPSEFEVSFLYNKIRYQYGFSADSERVCEEYLLAYLKGKPKTWFKRTYNPQDKNYQWAKFGSELDDIEEKYIKKIRDNALFLSKAAIDNHEKILPLFKWLTNQLASVKINNKYPPLKTLEMAQDELIKEKILSILKGADLGINNFYIEKKEFDKNDLPEHFKIDITDGPIIGYAPRIFHQDQDGHPIELGFDAESLGTRQLFGFTGYWFDAIEKNQSLFVDELDDSLHFLLTRMIIQSFQSQSISGHNQINQASQLIFNSHDVTLLDLSLFRRDQIWFIEKDSYGASHLYSLAEFIEEKNTIPLKSYANGRYGAIPFLREDILAKVLYDKEKKA